MIQISDGDNYSNILLLSPESTIYGTPAAENVTEFSALIKQASFLNFSLFD